MFTVVVVDNPGVTLTYQWQFNQVDISLVGGDTGVDSASLTVVAVDGSDAGMYRCVVTNTAGSTMSAEAELSVGEFILY